MEIYKYGRKWDKIASPHRLTDNDWLVVSILKDEVWFDDTTGLLTLKVGEKKPEWYQCEYNI